MADNVLSKLYRKELPSPPECLKKQVKQTSKALDTLFRETFSPSQDFELKCQSFYPPSADLEYLSQHITENFEAFANAFRTFLKRYSFSNSELCYAANSFRLPSSHPLSPQELTLLNDAQKNELLLILAYGRKLRSHYQHELSSIAKRLHMLVPQSFATLENNPIDPENYLRAFAAACNAMHYTFEHKVILFRVFFEKLQADLSGILADFNSMLIEQGILPELETTQDRTENHTALTATSITHQLLIHYLQRYHAIFTKQQLKADKPVRFELDKVLPAVCKTETKFSFEMLIDAQELALINECKAYFEQIFASSIPSTPTKALISSLQVLFFVNALIGAPEKRTANEKLKLLFNEMIDLGFDWVETKSASKHYAAEQLISATEYVGKNYFNNEHCIDECSKKLAALQSQANHFQLIKRRVLQSEHAKKASLDAHAYVSKMLHSKLEGCYVFDGLIHFCELALEPLLVNYYLKNATCGGQLEAALNEIEGYFEVLKKRTESAALSAINKIKPSFKSFMLRTFDALAFDKHTQKEILAKFTDSNLRKLYRYKNHFDNQLVGPSQEFPYKLYSLLSHLKSEQWIELETKSKKVHRLKYITEAVDSSNVIFYHHTKKPVVYLSKAYLYHCYKHGRFHLIDQGQVDTTLH